MIGLWEEQPCHSYLITVTKLPKTPKTRVPGGRGTTGLTDNGLCGMCVDLHCGWMTDTRDGQTMERVSEEPVARNFKPDQVTQVLSTEDKWKKVIKTKCQFRAATMLARTNMQIQCKLPIQRSRSRLREWRGM